MEKLYRVQMNKHGMPNFSTAEEIEPIEVHKYCWSKEFGNGKSCNHEFDPNGVCKDCGFMQIRYAVETCKDVISREWMLNELEEMNVASFYELNEHSKGAYEDMKRMIKAAPSVAVEPKQGKWIPCEERLPEAEKKVWIQTERGKVCFAMYEDGTISEDDSDWRWYDLDFENWDEENDCGIVPEGWWEWTEFHPDCEFDCPVDEKVVAWMPLPEPWKGADDEKR